MTLVGGAKRSTTSSLGIANVLGPHLGTWFQLNGNLSWELANK
jgi:hypothetical protein